MEEILNYNLNARTNTFHCLNMDLPTKWILGSSDSHS